MTIDGGRLDRRIELLVPSTVKSTVGQVISSYASVATFYGERLELRTSDAARAGQRDAFTLARYRIRYREGITTAMRIRADDRLYDIVSVEPLDRRVSMIIMVEEVASATVKP